MTQKWAVLAVLLLLPMNLVAAHNRLTVEAGHEAVLSCPNLSMVSLLLMTWKKNCSSCCLLSYRSDQKVIQKVNCSERIMWKYSSNSDPALHIYPVDLEDEGNYTCEVANSEGNFNFFSSLTVIVPPTVTLIPDQSRVAVCQASAAKPAADISWIPASNQSTEEEFHHPNGTVTRVSYFGWANSTSPSVTCLVTHPVTNHTLLLDLTYTSHRLLYLLIGAPAIVVAVVGVISCLIFRCRGESLDEPEMYYNPTADCAATKKKLKSTPVETRTPLHKRACGPAGPFATKNSTPSHVRREAVKPPVFQEKIYENYCPRSVYVF